VRANVLLRRVRAYQRRRFELERFTTGLSDRAEAARQERQRLLELDQAARRELAAFLAMGKKGPWTYRVAAEAVGFGVRP
jgi:hypothetical protein